MLNFFRAKPKTKLMPIKTETSDQDLISNKANATVQTSAVDTSNQAASQNIIEVKDVVKSFPVGDSEITILKGISFSVTYGEFVSIVGPSGNGKSTLLNMITGIDRPSSGEISAVERPVHGMSENDLAVWRGENVGIIFQFFQMLPALSLAQNVILPMEFAGKYTKDERKERAMHLLDQVGLADQANKLPGMVSGGQQQRAAIARALANDPPLLIGDEPTGNLDSKTEHEVFDIFESFIASGKTMLMVTHSKALAEQAHRKIEIIDGHIASDTVMKTSQTVNSRQARSVLLDQNATEGKPLFDINNTPLLLGAT